MRLLTLFDLQERKGVNREEEGGSRGRGWIKGKGVDKGEGSG